MNKRKELIEKYSRKYDVPKTIINRLIKSGLDAGLGLDAIEVGIRLVLGIETGGNKEFFTVEDVMKATGASREDVLNKIEEMKQEIAQMGVDPNEYFIKVKPPSEMN